MKTQNNSGTLGLVSSPPYAQRLFALVVLLAGLVGQPMLATSAAATGEKAREVVRETSVTVEKAGNAAANTAKELWQRIDEARLKNRTSDELVAWIMMGVLVGAVAGMMTPLKPTGPGQFGRLGLGLTGAFLGGIVVHLGQFDFGWGPVLIRYEELFFSLVGAVLIVAVGRRVRSRMKSKLTP